MKTVCWVTGVNKNYYKFISKKTVETWSLLQGDKKIIVDSPFLEYDSPYDIINAAVAYELLDKEKVNEISKKGGKFYKFFKKAVTFWYALKTLSKSYDYIIWLDSDVVVEKMFDVEPFLPERDHLYSSILKTNKMPDSGFVAVNTLHPDFEKFVDDYINYYIKDKIKEMPHPWDAYIIADYSTITSTKNLWKGVITDQSDRTCGFKDTMLEDVMTHYWGKKSKTTLIEELKNEI